MAENSKIEWTDATWNPILGCDKISPGCKNCYAIRTAHRLQSNPNPKVAKAFEGLTVIQGGQPNWTGRVNFVEERLFEPLRWRKPSMIFVNSQSDLFHEDVTENQIGQILSVMAMCPQHTFQVLTKRPERMREFFAGFKSAEQAAHLLSELRDENDIPIWDEETECVIHNMISGANGKDGVGWPMNNLWLGVSIEDQKRADERREDVRAVADQGWLTWVSYEPALGPVNWRGWEFMRWLVSGGESGKDARPSHPKWHQSTRDWCVDNGTAYLFKQWGEWLGTSPFDKKPDGNVLCHEWNGGVTAWKVGKKAAGRLLDGREWNEYPESL